MVDYPISPPRYTPLLTQSERRVVRLEFVCGGEVYHSLSKLGSSTTLNSRLQQLIFEQHLLEGSHPQVLEVDIVDPTVEVTHPDRVVVTMVEGDTFFAFHREVGLKPFQLQVPLLLDVLSARQVAVEEQKPFPVDPQRNSHSSLVPNHVQEPCSHRRNAEFLHQCCDRLMSENADVQSIQFIRCHHCEILPQCLLHFPLPFLLGVTEQRQSYTSLAFLRTHHNQVVWSDKEFLQL